jgi:hypothetical protein
MSERVLGRLSPSRRGVKHARPNRKLTLEETLVLRRKLAGMKHRDIGDELGKDIVWVNNRVQTACRRWGAASMKEFLEMPELLEALREGT